MNRLRGEESWEPSFSCKQKENQTSKVMELVGQDGFPHPRRLGARTFRWAPEAITEWLASAGEVRPRCAVAPRGRQIVERV